MAVVIARDIAKYLEAQGKGTVGVNIFYDFQPDNPPATITVYDAGGPSPEEPPEAWRELYVQVRSPDHASGYETVWETLACILYPSTPDGTIDVGDNQYMAQLQGIPSIVDRDQLNRYLFGFRLVVCNLAGNVQADPWLTALASWTAGALLDWTVYAGWRGFKRPSITWMLTGVQIKERGRGSYLLQKKFTGWILGRTPNEHSQAAAAVVTGLASAIKIPWDTASNTWLTVVEPAASANAQNNLLSQVAVTLQRVTLRPREDAPAIGVVTLTKEGMR